MLGPASLSKFVHLEIAREFELRLPSASCLDERRAS